MSGIGVEAGIGIMSGIGVAVSLGVATSIGGVVILDLIGLVWIVDRIGSTSKSAD